MFQTIINLYDVFREPSAENSVQNVKFSTNPADYLSKDGFYC